MHRVDNTTLDEILHNFEEYVDVLLKDKILGFTGLYLDLEDHLILILSHP